MTKRERINQELESIAAAHDGLLHPSAVVDFARQNPVSALHSEFEWDDKAAGHKYRIQQARQLIRLNVVYLKNHPQKVRAFVSLPEDRKEGGGYRATDGVLSDADKRASLLRQAMIELQAFRRKYAILNELSQVFAAADEIIGSEEVAG